MVALGMGPAKGCLWRLGNLAQPQTLRAWTSMQICGSKLDGAFLFSIIEKDIITWDRLVEYLPGRTCYGCAFKNSSSATEKGNTLTLWTAFQTELLMYTLRANSYPPPSTLVQLYWKETHYIQQGGRSRGFRRFKSIYLSLSLLLCSVFLHGPALVIS